MLTAWVESQDIQRSLERPKAASTKRTTRVFADIGEAGQAVIDYVRRVYALPVDAMGYFDQTKVADIRGTQRCEAMAEPVTWHRKTPSSARAI